jgi:hypothetical protein
MTLSVPDRKAFSDLTSYGGGLAGIEKKEPGSSTYPWSM